MLHGKPSFAASSLGANICRLWLCQQAPAPVLKILLLCSRLPSQLLVHYCRCKIVHVRLPNVNRTQGREPAVFTALSCVLF
jgi:hypothetical protein